MGSRATILPGVTIGDGAVIGAGSVVTTSVPARAVAVGNPARVISQDVAWAMTEEERQVKRPRVGCGEPRWGNGAPGD